MPAGYRQTEVGNVPNDWDVLVLNSIIEEISMGPFGSDITVSNFVSTGVPVLNGNNVSQEKLIEKFENFVTPAKARSLKKAVAGRGDIVVTHRGTIGQVAYIPQDSNFEKYVVSQSQFRVRLSSRVIPSWVVSYFHSHSGSKMLLEGKGHTGVPAIAQPTSTFRKLHIPVPTLGEQRAIAEALSDADALIESLEVLIAKKHAIKQGVMQDLLSGRKRLQGFAGEWQRRTFGELFHFLATATNSRSDLSNDGDTFYVHYGDIHTRFHSHLDFAMQGVPKILRARCSNAATLKNGDWIMADASEDHDGVCKSIEVSGIDEQVVAVSGLHTFLLREKDKAFAPGFKGHLGNSSELRRQYLRVMTGMKVYGVSKAALRNLVLPLPEWQEQEAIRDILDDMDSELGVLEARLGKAREIKQGMMQELLTGRVRLV